MRKIFQAVGPNGTFTGIIVITIRNNVPTLIESLCDGSTINILSCETDIDVINAAKKLETELSEYLQYLATKQKTDSLPQQLKDMGYA